MIIFITILVVFLLLMPFSAYNSLIKKRNQVTNAFSSIDVMLKKRFDLIPNLVEVVKRYAIHEHDTLTKIAEMRSRMLSGNLGPAEKTDLNNQLGRSVQGLIMTAENYPDLKADAHFRNLEATWTETEEQIAASRRTYNAAAIEYNNSIMTFPTNLFAKSFNFNTAQLFEATVEERKNISAKELFSN